MSEALDFGYPSKMSLLRLTLPLYISAGVIMASNTSRLVLIPFRAQELGASRLAIGLLFSVYAASAAAAALPAGYFADRVSRSKVLLLAVSCGAVSQLILAGTSSLSVAFGCQILGGAGASAATATLMAMLIDRTPSERFGWALGWMTLSNQLGYLIGPALAGTALNWISLRVDLAVMGCVALIAIPNAVKSVQFDQFGGHGTSSGRLWSTITKLLSSRDIYSIALAMLAATLLWGTVEAYLPLYAKDALQLPAQFVGYIFAAQAFVNAASRVPAGWLVDRWRSSRWLVTLAGTVGYAVCVAIAVQLPGTSPILLLIVAVTFVATSFVSLGARFGEVASASARGITMGFYSLTIFLGFAAGPTLFGSIMQRRGFETGLSSCALTVIALAAIAEVIGIKRSRS
jgi:MFS transporter, DHA1 family, multidrug resistance protein